MTAVIDIERCREMKRVRASERDRDRGTEIQTQNNRNRETEQTKREKRQADAGRLAESGRHTLTNAIAALAAGACATSDEGVVGRTRCADAAA